ncbi:low temperature requirement protein A [Microbacterium sp. ZW T5_56]|uniref:low temperature requirement protein A n=1 Tax=Microbacterium sp. ZW T5_56 TaxID=3378081 RepID=UPI0038549F64
MSDHTEGFYRHGLSRMLGRSTTEHGRVASPLELLFDLVFAAAFGVLGTQFAHGIAIGEMMPALGAFAFGGAAIIWAWINYSWFASAFDTDDWAFRLMTMLQMAGVIVLAIGLAPMFESLEHGEPIANQVMVAGYIVMRVAMIGQWLRAARSAEHRSTALTYVVCIAIAQVGWVIVAWVPMTLQATLVAAALCWVVELLGPILAERRAANGSTPWHPHHIAERYSLLAIITLGETVIGTIAAAQEVTAEEGWSANSIVVIAAGIAMTFAVWWTYFLLPSAPILEVHRRRAFVWGYGHAVLFLAIVAVGASLHLIGYVFDPEVHLSTVTVVSCLAASVIVYSLALYAIHAWLTREPTKNIGLQLPGVLLPALAIVLAVAGLPLWLCLLVVLAGPVGVVVAYETGGWRGVDAQLRRAVAVGPTVGA